MGNPLELRADRVVELFFAMAVNVAPERRHPVQILSSLHIDQEIAVAAADNARLFAHPFLHLRERVPKIAMVELFQFVVISGHACFFRSSKASSAFSMCSRVCVAIKVMRKREVPGGTVGGRIP